MCTWRFYFSNHPASLIFLLPQGHPPPTVMPSTLFAVDLSLVPRPPHLSFPFCTWRYISALQTGPVFLLGHIYAVTTVQLISDSLGL